MSRMQTPGRAMSPKMGTPSIVTTTWPGSATRRRRLRQPLHWLIEPPPRSLSWGYIRSAFDFQMPGVLASDGRHCPEGRVYTRFMERRVHEVLSDTHALTLAYHIYIARDAFFPERLRNV
jgi:hypothetical protein